MNKMIMCIVMKTLVILHVQCTLCAHAGGIEIGESANNNSQLMDSGQSEKQSKTDTLVQGTCILYNKYLIPFITDQTIAIVTIQIESLQQN